MVGKNTNLRPPLFVLSMLSDIITVTMENKANFIPVNSMNYTEKWEICLLDTRAVIWYNVLSVSIVPIHPEPNQQY
jgi:hypothetical protein